MWWKDNPQCSSHEEERVCTENTIFLIGVLATETLRYVRTNAPSDKTKVRHRSPSAGWKCRDISYFVWRDPLGIGAEIVIELLEVPQSRYETSTSIERALLIGSTRYCQRLPVVDLRESPVQRTSRVHGTRYRLVSPTSEWYWCEHLTCVASTTALASAK